MSAGAEHRQVEFFESVPLFFKNYFNFQGRSSRGAYWWWVLASLGISIVLSIADISMFSSMIVQYGVGPVGLVFSLATLIPGVALSIRRLHDIGKSGWWLLIVLIPLICAIVLIYWACQPGLRADTQFGPDVEAGK